MSGPKPTTSDPQMGHRGGLRRVARTCIWAQYTLFTCKREADKQTNRSTNKGHPLQVPCSFCKVGLEIALGGESQHGLPLQGGFGSSNFLRFELHLVCCRRPQHSVWDIVSNAVLDDSWACQVSCRAFCSEREGVQTTTKIKRKYHN